MEIRHWGDSLSEISSKNTCGSTSLAFIVLHKYALAFCSNSLSGSSKMSLSTSNGPHHKTQSPEYTCVSVAVILLPLSMYERKVPLVRNCSCHSSLDMFHVPGIAWLLGHSKTKGCPPMSRPGCYRLKQCRLWEGRGWHCLGFEGWNGATKAASGEGCR